MLLSWVKNSIPKKYTPSGVPWTCTIILFSIKNLAPLNGLWSPRIPVHWVVLVLSQVGRQLRAQPVPAFEPRPSSSSTLIAGNVRHCSKPTPGKRATARQHESGIFNSTNGAWEGFLLTVRINYWATGIQKNRVMWEYFYGSLLKSRICDVCTLHYYFREQDMHIIRRKLGTRCSTVLIINARI